MNVKLTVAQFGSRVCSIALAIILIADLALKPASDFQELLWACYWSCVVLVAGTLLSLDILIASASLFFVGLGFPAWVIAMLIHYRPMEPTSLLMHLVPLGSASLYLSGTARLPRRSGFGAWLLFLVPFGLSALFCDPQRNINLVQMPWKSFHALFPSLWAYRLSLLVVSAGCAQLTQHFLIMHLAHRKAGVGPRPH